MSVQGRSGARLGLVAVARLALTLYVRAREEPGLEILPARCVGPRIRAGGIVVRDYPVYPPIAFNNRRGVTVLCHSAF